MSVRLDGEEEGILRYLERGYEKSMNLDDITDYLNKSNYVDKKTKNPITFSVYQVRDKLNHLIEEGYVRAKTNKNEEKFYLSNVLGGLEGGVGKRRTLQGRGPWHDTKTLVKRLFGSVFLLMGLGLFAYEGPKLTGAVIGTHTSGFLVGALFIFVGLAFFFIKPKKNKKRK